jgi:hypothetical protein
MCKCFGIKHLVTGYYLTSKLTYQNVDLFGSVYHTIQMSVICIIHVPVASVSSGLWFQTE